LNDCISLYEIERAVIRGDADTAARLTRAAIVTQVAPGEVLEKGLLAGMSHVGRLFKDGEVFVPDVLVAVRAMKAGMAELEPLLAACGIEPVGRIVIGSVKGDVHDIGKNLVSMMLIGAGFEVIDVGVNVSVQKFTEAIRAHNPQIIGMSALLTTTMVQMRANLEAWRREGLLCEAKVIVGGAPVTARFAEEIGADGYAKTAADAVDLAVGLIRQQKILADAGAYEERFKRIES
jgi:5-methyltetrahydrofolate--homocysteine methyltransferase